MTVVLCPYCGKPALLVTGVEIYPHRHDLAEKKFWRCQPCDAYVGCHPASKRGRSKGTGQEPLGRLANAELRLAKRMAHDAFDPLWSGVGAPCTRRRAYELLARQLGLETNLCHIGMFDVQQCFEAIEAVKALKEQPLS